MASNRATDRHLRNLFDNSVERVINTTIKVLEDAAGSSRSARIREDADTALQDWIALKESVCRVWDEARNQAVIERQSMSNRRRACL